MILIFLVVLAYLGKNLAILRRVSTLLCLRSHSDGFYSIMARPLSPTGDNFGIGITGQNFDPTHLADPAKAVEFIKAETGRVDLEFGEFTWLSHFRYGQ